MEEKKELPEILEQSSLQLKIGKLEKQISDLKVTTQEKVDVLKGKIQTLHAKNMELIEKVKEQSLIIKDKITGNSFVKKIKDFFAKEKIKPTKKIICYEIGGDVAYMKGFIKYSKQGYFTISDADLIEYSEGLEPLVLRHVGSAVICKDNVVMWF